MRDRTEMRDHADKPDQAREDPTNPDLRDQATRDQPMRDEPDRDQPMRDLAMRDAPTQNAGQTGMREAGVGEAGVRDADGTTAARYEGPTVPVPRDRQTSDRGPNGQHHAPGGEVWDDGAWRDLHERWRDVQLRFVDDPSGTVTQAQSIVDEAVRGYTEALVRRRAELDSWRSAGNTDTEVLRSALCQYRDFLETLH